MWVRKLSSLLRYTRKMEIRVQLSGLLVLRLRHEVSTVPHALRSYVTSSITSLRLDACVPLGSRWRHQMLLNQQAHLTDSFTKIKVMWYWKVTVKTSNRFIVSCSNDTHKVTERSRNDVLVSDISFQFRLWFLLCLTGYSTFRLLTLW